MGCFSFLIMLLSYCHNFPVNIYLLAVTCFSPGAVKFIQRIHLHNFFFLSVLFFRVLGGKFDILYIFLWGGREEDIILSLLFLFFCSN